MCFGLFLIIQIAYGRLSPNTKGYCDLDLFIQQKDGKKIVDPDKQSALCSRLKVEMLHPLRVIIANRGPDTDCWLLIQSSYLEREDHEFSMMLHLL